MMNEAIDYSTVKWVKQELDATLKQARQALEAYVESPEDESQLRFCAVHLHQVAGTLQMVELYGAALLAEEMEQVVESLLAGSVGQKQEAYELIMRAILQLPDYLERLIAGHRDLPLVLLPLLNDLRAIRGQKLLSENSLFSPDLSQPVPLSALVPHSGEDIRALARKQRHTYQLALLGWFRGKDTKENLTRLSEVMEKIQAACSKEPCQRLWWVARGMIVAVREEWLDTSMSTKLLLGQIDRQVKRIIDEGESALTDDLPNDLIKNLLFYVARSKDGGEPVTTIKKTYNLKALLPDEQELAHAQDSLSGHNAELMVTVSAAIKEDLARVKDALDLFLRGGRKTVADLQPAAETLARVSDTLGMLGLGALRKAAQKQAQSATDMVEGRRDPEESALMEIASSLLYVESSLDGLVHGGSVPAQPEGEEQESGEIGMPDAEFNQVRGVVADEAIRDITQAKDAILGFIENTTDFAQLEKVPQLFHQIKGGLLLLNEQRAADIIDAVRGYVADRILAEQQVPSDAGLDDLADSISSIEYYLESFREGRVFGHSILDVASKSLERLGCAIVTQERDEQAEVEESVAPALEAAPVAEPGSTLLDIDDGGVGLEDLEPTGSNEIDGAAIDAPAFDAAAEAEYADLNIDIEPAPEDADLNIDVESAELELGAINEAADPFSLTSEIEEPIVLPAEPEIQIEPTATTEPEPGESALPQQGAKPAVPAAMALSEDIDDEILEIFIEESEEELANISEFLPRWLGNEEDRDALVDMRRSFHTLKGSGRLVGAVRIGEFAWAFENMLNRVIDGTIVRDGVLCGLLERAGQALPELVAQIRDGAETTLPIEAMAEMAQACSRGESVDLSDLGTETYDGVEPEAQQEPVAETESVDPDVAEAVGEPEDHILAQAIEVSEPFVAESGSANEAEADLVDTGIDPVLYDIFSNESHDHVATIRAFVEECRACGTDCRISDDLLRALHTLHGSARMAGADAIAEIAYEIEKYGKALRSENRPMPDEGMDLVTKALEMIETLLVQLREPASVHADYAALVDAVARLPRATPSVSHIPSAEVPAEDDDFESSLDIGDINVDAVELAEPLSQDIPEEVSLGESENQDSDPFLESIDTADVFGEEVDPFAEGMADSQDDVMDQDPTSEAELESPVEVHAELPALEPEDDFIEIVDEIELEQPEAFDTELETEPSSTIAAEGEELVSFDYEGADQDLIDVFLEEGEEILEASDATLHKWIQAPDDDALMAELQRHLHTLKGGARMASISAIGDLSHALESLLIAVTDGLVKPSTELFDVLLVAQDRLVHMVEAVRDQKPMRAAAGVIAQLEALRRGEPVAEFAPSPTESVSPEVPAEPQDVQADDAAVGAKMAAPAIESEVVPVPEEKKASGRAQQELVRVRADLLDNMVNYAGEISIYRSRLEQQVGSMRFNLSELGQTVDRIRDQLRKLEIETEAQVLFRYEREAGAMDEQFDPLEMDRYSHLQQLSRSMMESISDLVSIQGLMDNITRESETLLVQQSRVNTELQEGLMRTRMVPFAGLAPRMRRIVRQAAQELGKRAELVLEGTEGEMDRTVIDRIIAPIEHMLRNAIAHGIEMPDQRKTSGKKPAGTIKVGLARDGSEVVITLADDGAGMNLAAIRRKATERGLITDESNLTDTDIMQFVLETGFSTAEKVSQISGRGVGMDVVNSEVKQLGGSLHIDSRQGQGTTFTIRLPFTLAISQALLVQVHEEIYAIPLTGIEGIVRMSQDELSRYLNNANEKFEYAGYSYPLYNLGAMLGHGAPALGAGSSKRHPVLLVRSGDHRMALQVESLLGSRETVVKSVGPQISTVRGISGATILGDGRVVLILDLGGLLRSGGVSTGPERAAPEPARTEDRPLLVMVVDDSITVRKVTTRLLERNDMEVVTAKDGVDAVAKLQEHMPDVMLLDIEMPRMDGFELATHVRNEARLRHIPIIMITSRTGDKHRKRAMEIGVNRYLGKPFQESELLENIKELSEERRSNG